jgi:hypothetical protein
MRKSATTTKRMASGSKGTMNLHTKKDEAEAGLLAIKERREHSVKGRQATKSDKKTFADGTLFNKGPAAQAAAGDDQYPKVSTSLPVTSPHHVAFSATAPLDQRCVLHGNVDTAAQLHVCKGARGKGERILLRAV